MPCGRMSIASRKRACERRASAIARSASARLRTISPISAATFRALSLGLTRERLFAGDVPLRGLALLVDFCRNDGMTRPTRNSSHPLWWNCLKKRYRRAASEADAACSVP